MIYSCPPLRSVRLTTSDGIMRAVFDQLRGADLSGADLTRVPLSGKDLSGCSLAGANLRGANLRETQLREASLAGADLVGVDGTTGTTANVLSGSPAALAGDRHCPL